jgi:hypothetical protein
MIILSLVKSILGSRAAEAREEVPSQRREVPAWRLFFNKTYLYYWIRKTSTDAYKYRYRWGGT